MKYANIICVIHVNNFSQLVVAKWSCENKNIDCLFMIKSNLYNLCFSYLTVDDEWRKTKRFKNKKHQTVLIIGLQILNTVKNKRNYTVCTTGIKEWDMTDRTALQEAEIVVEIDETVLKRARWAGMQM